MVNERQNIPIPAESPEPAPAAERMLAEGPEYGPPAPAYPERRRRGLKARETPSAGMAAANREHCGVWAEWIERYGGQAGAGKEG